MALLGGLAALAIALSAVGTAFGALRYASSSLTLTNDSSGKPLSVLCPRKTKVVGGGVLTVGGNPEEDVEVSATLPDDLGAEPGSQPDDGWIAEAANSSDDVGRMIVDAVCSTSGAPKYRHRTSPLAAEGGASNQVLCPRGTNVTGGGVTTSGSGPDFEVAGTLPVDDGDRGSKPDDGWKGRTTNSSATDAQMTVFAICAHFPSLKYRKHSVQVASHSSATDSVRCPVGTRVTGGGVDVTRGGLGGLEYEVPGTFADDGNDRDRKPDDKWGGKVFNDDPAAAKMTTFVICK
jgi:hypothetical protein